MKVINFYRSPVVVLDHSSFRRQGDYVFTFPDSMVYSVHKDVLEYFGILIMDTWNIQHYDYGHCNIKTRGFVNDIEQCVTR